MHECDDATAALFLDVQTQAIAINMDLLRIKIHKKIQRNASNFLRHKFMWFAEFTEKIYKYK